MVTNDLVNRQSQERYIYGAQFSSWTTSLVLWIVQLREPFSQISLVPMA